MPVQVWLGAPYLHHVLDTWFSENYSGVGEMVRYADDAIFIFDDVVMAKNFKEALINRFAEFDLKLNEDKSGIVEFGPKLGNIIPLLGFVCPVSVFVKKTNQSISGEAAQKVFV